MLQRLRVGVLAGLHKVVQVEVARDERGGSCGPAGPRAAAHSAPGSPQPAQSAGAD